ncbi:Zn(II)2Cys6 transcription factor [Aspergillus mulundensis]|uniref:Putative Zn(II)2Cys6 transcription factor n=1 Tax=Aspergillus mulundensis TaxID=1810919 RepID=A0A3D8SL45_9EURO|nr:putative Zn(II)2Cys6 transcription factor [Aspergillus mulundensis]RDW87047.1 putative Zn(II)2Cys6 transcription factor [Aspergillus mulundensis]
MQEACYTCRRRHVQCDRSGNPCRKCETAGLKCLDKRPIRWVQGVAIRGAMRGRSHQNDLVSANPVATLDFRQGTSGKPLEPLEQSASNELVPTIPPSSIPVSLKDKPLTKLDPSAQYYLDYYNDRICQLFIVYDSVNNPFRSLIPLALNDSVLLDAVLALAARHRANFEQPFSTTSNNALTISPAADREALRFKYRAIQGLSTSLGAGNSYRDTTVASVFLLVFLDLLESGCDRWNYHLEGAKTLMALTPNQDPGRTVERIRRFIIKQLHLIEALGATFVRPDLLSKSSSVEESYTLLEDVVEESFLGCPEFILTAVQLFSLQRDIIARNDASNRSPTEDITSVLDAVRDFDCRTWASTLPRESVKHDINDLTRLAKAYQLGGILYGQRVIDAAQKSQTSQMSATSELIQVINLLQHTNLLKCTLWPITVGGLECQAQPERDMLIQALEKFWQDTKCLNVTNAANILQDYWRKIDSGPNVANDWIFEMGRSSHDWLLI